MSLLDTAADIISYCSASTKRIGVLVLYEIIVSVAINLIGYVYVDKVALLHSNITTPMLTPDVRFGYSPLELDELYLYMGPIARRNYIYLELFDIFQYMPAYVLLLSTLLTTAYMKLHGKVSLLAYLPFFTVICDLIENTSQIYTAYTFQERISLHDPTWLLAAYTGTTGNILKWITLIASIVILIITSIRAALYGKTYKNE
ncbi:hypothetical protein THRCLA_10180 [Thraustotheca clavata]|uniref:Uncharacterized protein n=1 Tax=Thraustotheca clavata TaxID=74557 RepID=A0A1V9YSS0_9STRA|nr:hypothetical protein THRCLA_10180 [Thraustotheca clavata]